MNMSNSAAAENTLLGSDRLPAIIMRGDQPVQLGTLVALAHERSRLSVGAWNDLNAEVRELILDAELALMHAGAWEASHA